MSYWITYLDELTADVSEIKSKFSEGPFETEIEALEDYYKRLQNDINRLKIELNETSIRISNLNK